MRPAGCARGITGRAYRLRCPCAHPRRGSRRRCKAVRQRVFQDTPEIVGRLSAYPLVIVRKSPRQDGDARQVTPMPAAVPRTPRVPAMRPGGISSFNPPLHVVARPGEYPAPWTSRRGSFIMPDPALDGPPFRMGSPRSPPGVSQRAGMSPDANARTHGNSLTGPTGSSLLTALLSKARLECHARKAHPGAVEPARSVRDSRRRCCRLVGMPVRRGGGPADP
jgi:hypothetical protein